MKGKLILATLFLGIVATLGVCETTGQGELTTVQRTLAGIDATFVVVRPLTDEQKSYGLDQEKLKSIIKTRLVENGIKVCTIKELQKKGFQSCLSLNIKSLKSNNGAYFYSITAEFSQISRLLRRPYYSCLTKTWDKNVIGCSTQKSLFAQQIETKFKNLANQFTEDYSKANPLEKSPKSR